jgi:hypothetical protein
MTPAYSKGSSIITIIFALFFLAGLTRVGIAQSGADSPQPDSTVETSVLQDTRTLLGKVAETIQGFKRRYEEEKKKIKNTLKRRQKRRTASLVDSLTALGCDCADIAQDAVHATFARQWHLKNVKRQAKLVGRILEKRREILNSPIAEYLSGNSESILRDEDALEKAQERVKKLVRHIEQLEKKKETQTDEQVVPENIPGTRSDWNATEGLEGKIDSAKTALEEARYEADMIRSERSMNGAIRAVSTDVFVQSKKLMADARNRWDRVVDHFTDAKRSEKTSRRKRQLLQTEAQDAGSGPEEDDIDVTDNTDAEEY